MRLQRSAIAVFAALVLVGCASATDTDGPADATAAEPESDRSTDDEVDDISATGGDDEGDDGDDPNDDSEPPEPEPLDPLEGVALELVSDGLVEPVDVTVIPGNGGLLVVERRGVIRFVADGESAAVPFADLTGVVHANSIEQGLLGLALHPDHPSDPRAFLYHSLPNNDNVLVSYRVTAAGDGLDLDSRQVLLTVDKEPDKVRHNGGQVVFGPDGLLYVSVGDAARASVNGQDPTTLPGTILRLDIDGADPYDIPADNPFADGAGGAPEVWWYGLRNPWRFSIDARTGLAYIADVGQETVEEVNVVPFDEGGLNFGWPVFEGTGTFYGGEPASDVTDPVLESRHDDTDQACSITGGHVYRGAAIPELDGHYLYADWCRGWIRSFRYDAGQVTEEQDWSGQLDTQMVSAFGVDADGELLIVDYAAGSLFRIVAIR